MNYFKLEELVDRKTFDQMGMDCWKLFPMNALTMLENVREFFGVPIIVNNWHKGGKYSHRGYRPKNCPEGPNHLAQRTGHAFIIDVRNHTAEKARKRILAEQNHPLLTFITKIEDTNKYLYIDCTKLKLFQKRILLFK